MSTAFHEGYISWLYGLIGSTTLRDPTRSYWSLARQLYSRPFTWTIRNDDNREMDGRELRFEYLDAIGQHDYDLAWMARECTIFEMLIALSRRASFETQMEPVEWFWKFLENLELDHYSDAAYNPGVEHHVHQVLDRLIHRNYAPDGRGGIFPLKHPYSDQRNVEIWSQMSLYILENDPIGIVGD